ncbi:glycosyltransferase family 8 protein [Lactarius hatsudake]|nr:glycosyltransferase family 8 protein [Lactarius hatsudake]
MDCKLRTCETGWGAKMPSHFCIMAVSLNEQFVFTPTQDWFSFNVEAWKTLLPLVLSKAPRALEIGSWEGRSAVFLLTELCKTEGEIVCIDHFDLMRTQAGRERYSRIQHNLALAGGRFRVKDKFSVPALMEVLVEEMSATVPGFDWVYVDGSHEADDTFLDGELAWRLAKKGAVFIFDDYHWDTQPQNSRHHPKRGIDAFLSLHEGEYHKISGEGQYQMVLQKTSDMRIGFIVEDKIHDGLESALGYGANVAYTVDESYVTPLMVSIHSLLKATTGRVSIYVLDCGLSEEGKQAIVKTIATREDVTLTFLELPPDSLAREKGAMWARIDLISAMPVERTLYLDADTLVFGDIQSLWKTDLGGDVLGAAVDVGHPYGHEGVGRGKYFNSGVLLMDLAGIRRRLPQIKELARGAHNWVYKDQDLLNVHFRGEWHEVSLIWNAQGLGTYADGQSTDRAQIATQMEEMKAKPSLVHFTGPTNPDVEIVLNPWVQPYTAKPWGYAGAPGHPFSEAWWKTLREIPGWEGHRTSRAFGEYTKREKGMALERAQKKLEDIGRIR